MSRFQFLPQAKFAFVTFTNVYTDISNEQQLPDGTWVFPRFPVEIDHYWKEWIGTIGIQKLEDSNLFIMSSEASTLPQVLDDHHEKLKKKVSQIFSLLQMLESIEYYGARLLCGSFFEGKSHIRQMSEFPAFYQTRGYTRVPVTIERLGKAAELQKVLIQIESVPDAFRRFKKGWLTLLDGLQKITGEQRIHQFVRALEALIMPRIGKTKSDFMHRCQTFAKANQNTRQILEQSFDLRSMEEHLNECDQARSLPKDTRENIEILALRRTRQMELLTRFAYTRIMEDATLRENFSTETKQQAFWNLPDDQRKNFWDKQLDLT